MSDLAKSFAPRARRSSPARVQRRRLAVELALALVLAVVFVSVAGGLGVVAFFGIPILIIGLLSLGAERVFVRRRHRRRSM